MMNSMILLGNCLDVLKALPANSVHCCVTSPPYWSLRDYGVPPSIWGGDPLCAHEWAAGTVADGFSGKRKWQHAANGRGEKDDTVAEATMPSGSSRGQSAITRASEPEVWTHFSQGQFCIGCGAWRGCLGLEPTIDLYIDHLVEIFEEVRRVLRKDGTCWLNLGDCYAAGGRGGNTGARSGLQGSTESQEESKRAGQRIGHRSLWRRDRAPRMDVPHKGDIGLKRKDLCMVPARVAIALQAAGWYLRSDIILAKTNPMPESTRDRPTKSHEYVFLLAKSGTYYYDAHAIREGVTGNSHSRGAGVHPKAVARVGRGTGIKANQSFSAAVSGQVGSRNRRSVWRLPTAPFKGAHFATFSPRLVEPCILAGTSEHGCCSVCGAPYKRIVKLGDPCVEQMEVAGADRQGKYAGKATKDFASAGAQDASATKARILDGMRERITVGWKPTCKHTLLVQPCVVLDPFGGSGTTAMVAARLGRDYLLIELGAHNVAMAEDRVALRRIEASA